MSARFSHSAVHRAWVDEQATQRLPDKVLSAFQFALGLTFDEVEALAAEVQLTATELIVPMVESVTERKVRRWWYLDRTLFVIFDDK